MNYVVPLLAPFSPTLPTSLWSSDFLPRRPSLWWFDVSSIICFKSSWTIHFLYLECCLILLPQTLGDDLFGWDGSTTKPKLLRQYLSLIPILAVAIDHRWTVRIQFVLWVVVIILIGLQLRFGFVRFLTLTSHLRLLLLLLHLWGYFTWRNSEIILFRYLRSIQLEIHFLWRLNHIFLLKWFLLRLGYLFLQINSTYVRLIWCESFWGRDFFILFAKTFEWRWTSRVRLHFS